MKTIFRYLLILPLIAATSCLRESFEDFVPHAPDHEKDVMFKLAIPFTAPQTPATRSIGAAQENAIATVDILSFKVEGGVETFQYRTEARKVAAHSEGASLQAFTAKLRVQDYEQRFVLITNAADKIEALIESHADGSVGVEKETLLGKLTFDLNGDRWKTIDDKNFTAIPMWGETAPKKIGATTPSVSDAPIPMLRMIAKVDVELDVVKHPKLSSTFQLKSVYVYNTNGSGRVVPKPGAEYIGADMKAVKASLPDNIVASKDNPMIYADFNTPGETDVAMRGAIYLFETAAKNAGDFLKETGIVVGGIYGTDSEMSYYRLDFSGQDDKKHMDVLRNHMYVFKIVKVDGRGHESPDNAYRSQSYNMAANLIVWDMGDIREIVFDSQYMLGVSHNRFDLDADVHDTHCPDNMLKITTDNPTGWEASVWADREGETPLPVDASNKSWLSITPDKGAKTGAKPDEIRLITQENTGDERTAYVHIKAGRLSYIVTVVQEKERPGTLTVTPNSIVLPNTIAQSEQYKVQVTAKKASGLPDNNTAWKLTSANPAWLRLSLSSTDNFNAAAGEVSATGEQTVYLYAANNSLPDARRTTIYKGGTIAETMVDVLQYGNFDNIIKNDGAGEPPLGVKTYVGAFWKANEKGERLIRIEAGANNANTGAWTAKVMWTDQNWNAGDVLLDTKMISEAELENRGISFSKDMNPDTYGSPETHTVTDGGASGNVTATDRYIFFRIGLKSTYTPTTAHPARYAVVLLSYAGNTKHQKIFLRQGENPDYLMTNNDPIAAGSDLKQARTMSKKFAVYNLTAKTLGDNVIAGGAIFTKYPTQAGALWMWGTNTGNTGLLGKAYHPNANPSDSDKKMFGTTASDFWDKIKDVNEVSPEGFRRPTDGITNANEPGSPTSIANSEMRQSLFWKIRDNFNYSNETANSIWGYYADGFFDRRRTENGLDSGDADVDSKNTTVLRNDPNNIAHIGRLFFNPLSSSERYNASLFFPAAGTIGSNGGNLMLIGGHGNYWSSSQNYDNAGITLIIKKSHAGPWRQNKYSGASIRPVVK